MTRDELRKRIEIILNNYSIGYDLDHINANQLRVEHILNTIFDALKEPTDEMIFAAGKAWGITVTSNEYENMEDEWRLMLSASPLAPEE